MGKLKTVGVIAGILVAVYLGVTFAFAISHPVTAVDGPGVVAASVDDKYAGLTQKQVTHVKIWKEMCDKRAENASYTSETLGQVQAAKCEKGEASGIEGYRAENIRMNATLDR